MKKHFQKSILIVMLIGALISTSAMPLVAQDRISGVTDHPQATNGDVVNLPVPMVRQVWDTANTISEFNGNCACGPTSAVMALAYFQKIRPNPMTLNNAAGPHTTDYGWYVSNDYQAVNGHRFSTTSPTCSPPYSTSSGWQVKGTARAGAWGSIMIASGDKKGNADPDLMATYLNDHGIEVENLNRSRTTPEQDKAVMKHALDQGFLVIAFSTMKTLGHVVLVRGYTNDDNFILNDPYGVPTESNYKIGGSQGGRNIPVKFPGNEWTQIKSLIIVKGQRDTDDNRRFDSFGQTLNGVLTPNADDDIYWFNGNAGNSVKINMNATAGSLDTFLELYKPDGGLLAINDDSNNGQNSEIQVSLPTTGDYKIIAHSYNRSSGGSYTLAFNGAAPATDTDDGRWLAASGSLPGNITPASDRDTSYFNGSAGTVVNLRMNKTDASLDSYLELYGPTGSPLAYNDDGGGSVSRNAWIAYRLPVNGAYRVVARSYNLASSGRYNLSLQVERTNYALSLAPDASSQADQSISPAYATDGDMTTAWSSGEAATQRLMLDLGETRTLNQAIIRWNGGDYASGYGLYYQDENGAWQPLFATDSGDGDVDILEFAPITTAHVLVEMWQRPALSSHYSMSEFEVHNTDSVLIPLVPPDDTDKSEETNVTPLAPLAPNPDGKDAPTFALGADQESFPLSDADATVHTPSVAITATYRFPTTTLTLSGNLLLPGGSITTAAINPHDQDSQQIGTGIAAYRWTLIPAEIGPSGGYVIPVGDQPTLVLSSNEKLDSGRYYLQLEVQDDEGSWSQPVGEFITVGWNLYLPLIKHN
ncbi:MAG: discoidin domain-containing protein [Chloroflexi bacterium]|nr:discoidin domain-containing protein [Chloroflexota bacterium]